MAALPPGWGDRHNQMSERDMQLGGAAATKFGGTARNAYEGTAGDGGDGGGYKNSDQVREFYLNQIEKRASRKDGVESSGGDGGTMKSVNALPDHWAERQKERELQAKQMGVFSKTQPPVDANADCKRGGDEAPSSAEVALVQVATHALEKMAGCLGQSNRGGGVKIPMAERAAFAKAVKEAMDALARQV